MGRKRRQITAPRLLTSRVYIVRGGSMSPTLEPGHHLLADRRAYAEYAPSRGDIVIVGSHAGTDKPYLKRVVGLPREEVRFLDSMLFIDGAGLPESYLGGLPSTLGTGDRDWKLGGDEYFVLGDNRTRSSDSREFGPVAADLILGKVWFRYWPLGLWGAVK